jgi:hypothetical protein
LARAWFSKHEIVAVISCFLFNPTHENVPPDVRSFDCRRSIILRSNLRWRYSLQRLQELPLLRVLRETRWHVWCVRGSSREERLCQNPHIQGRSGHAELIEVPWTVNPLFWHIRPVALILLAALLIPSKTGGTLTRLCFHDKKRRPYQSCSTTIRCVSETLSELLTLIRGSVRSSTPCHYELQREPAVREILRHWRVESGLRSIIAVSGIGCGRPIALLSRLRGMEKFRADDLSDPGSTAPGSETSPLPVKKRRTRPVFA